MKKLCCIVVVGRLGVKEGGWIAKSNQSLQGRIQLYSSEWAPRDEKSRIFSRQVPQGKLPLALLYLFHLCLNGDGGRARGRVVCLPA